MKTTGILYIISAPSGAGKSSLINALIKSSFDYMAKVSISHTTRNKRPQEKQGEHYYFTTCHEFEALIEENAFLEYAHIFNHYYGTSRAMVEENLQQGVDVFLDIDWQGARQVRQQTENVKSIFILPPSKNALKQRLISRGQDNEEIINDRMQKAVAEMSHYNEYDYLIINDQFEIALKELQTIVKAEKLTLTQQRQKHQQLITKLLAQ